MTKWINKKINRGLKNWVHWDRPTGIMITVGMPVCLPLYIFTLLSLTALVSYIFPATKVGVFPASLSGNLLLHIVARALLIGKPEVKANPGFIADAVKAYKKLNHYLKYMELFTWIEKAFEQVESSVTEIKGIPMHLVFSLPAVIERNHIILFPPSYSEKEQIQFKHAIEEGKTLPCRTRPFVCDESLVRLHGWVKRRIEIYMQVIRLLEQRDKERVELKQTIGILTKKVNLMTDKLREKQQKRFTKIKAEYAEKSNRWFPDARDVLNWDKEDFQEIYTRFQSIDSTCLTSVQREELESILREIQQKHLKIEIPLVEKSHIMPDQQEVYNDKVGPRSIPGWKLHDVEDLGNCFYDAVCHQMQRNNHPFLLEIPEGTLPRDSLRLCVQGECFQDRDWADIREIRTTLLRVNNIAIAIADTRHPELGYRYYYLNENQLRDTQSIAELAPEVIIIKLAYTGNHYLSVEQEPEVTDDILRMRADSNGAQIVYDVPSAMPNAIARSKSLPNLTRFFTIITNNNSTYSDDTRPQKRNKRSCSVPVIDIQYPSMSLHDWRA